LKPPRARARLHEASAVLIKAGLDRQVLALGFTVASSGCNESWSETHSRWVET
jgi:hypothetical protein